MSHSARKASFIAALFIASLWSISAMADDWKSKVPFWHGSVENAGWSALFHADASKAMAKLPKGVQTMLKADIVDNPWVKGHEEMKTKLGKFRPEARQVFDLPYIPIPASKMKFKYMDSAMSATMKGNVKYKKGGQDMIRFFFHPLYADKYRDLINTYGAKYGEYWATPTSSPRSLVVWQKNAPKKPIWVKVSLHAHLDYYTRREKNGTEKKIGISRVQSEKKAYRSALVNQAFRTTTTGERTKHMIDFMPEPASFVPGDIRVAGKRVGFDRSTIFRELPTALTNTRSQTRFVPAFTFIKNLKETSRRNRVPVMELAKKGLIEPLVRSYLYLGLEHGLQGEMHTQNFLLEVNKKGMPTGKVMVKDLDGYRMDLDMRIRNNKSIDFLNNYKHPFMWAKHSATQGSTTYPAVLHAWFNKLIRNVNGFTTTRNGKKVYATPSGQLMEQLQKDFPREYAKLKKDAIRLDSGLRRDAGKAQRKAVENVFDVVAREQFKKITGIAIPTDKWGFGQNKGLNWGLNQLRGQMFTGQKRLDSKEAQSTLRTAFNRLRTSSQRKADDRTWVRGKPHSFRLIGNNVIEGVSLRGKPVGYALIKPADMGQFNTAMRRANLRSKPKTRPVTGLSRYTARPTGVRPAFKRGR